MSNKRVKRAIAACRKRYDLASKVQLFAVKYCISSRSFGFKEDDVNVELKAVLDEWAMALLEMKYREELLLRFIDEETDGNVSEAKEFLDENTPEKSVWRKTVSGL